MYLLALLTVLSVCQLESGLFHHPFEKPLVNEVAGFTLTVDNMDTSLEFYTKLLHFRKISEFTLSGKDLDKLFHLSDVKVRIVKLLLGQESLELIEFLQPKGRKIPANASKNDFNFQHLAIVVSNIDEAYLSLLKQGVSPSSLTPGHVPSSGSETGDVAVFYFKDPDHHQIQLIAFPPGKGESKWQRSLGQLFLGINHFAMTIKNTEKSLQFYHSLLGLKNAETRFYGDWKEERLKHVKTPKVQATLLESSYGPTLQLLQYIKPELGKEMPPNTKPNDMWSVLTQLSTLNIDRTHLKMMQSKAFLLSSIPIKVPNAPYKKAFLAKDPDGHFVLISSPY